MNPILTPAGRVFFAYVATMLACAYVLTAVLS